MLYFDNDILGYFRSKFISLMYMYLVANSDDEGVLVTSYRKISKETGWEINPIRIAIEELVDLHTIHTESTHQGTLITILTIGVSKDLVKKSTHSLHSIHTEKKKVKPVEDELTFDFVWDIYHKKEGRCEKLENKWNGLSYEDRKNAVDFIPAYVAMTEEMYRKKFSTFLNQRTWENDNIYTNGISVPFGSFNPKLVQDHTLFPQFVERFNLMVAGTKIPQVDLKKGLTEKRRVLFNIAYCLHFYDMKKVMENVISNPRYNGTTGFVADFDFIFKPDNFIRIYEGS